jgi:hypothetical protein
MAGVAVLQCEAHNPWQASRFCSAGPTVHGGHRGFTVRSPRSLAGAAVFTVRRLHSLAGTAGFSFGHSYAGRAPQPALARFKFPGVVSGLDFGMQ